VANIAGMRRLALALACLIGLLVPGGSLAAPLPAAPNCPLFPATNVWNKRVDVSTRQA